MEQIRAVLVDIDGVLTVSWRPLPGTVEALAQVRASGYRIALLTNTTSRTRASIAESLAAGGFRVGPEDILTAPMLTAAHLAAHHPGARCVLLNSGDVAADLAGVTIVDDEDPLVDVVVVDGAGDEFSYAALNRAFRHVQGGARLVAMHHNLCWRTDEGLQLDSGAFLLGVEQAAGVEAQVVGKPSDAFFAAALDRLGVPASAALMVGDDVDADVLAAQRNGITGVLVGTGKYRAATHAAASLPPDHVLDSFADLPDLLSGHRVGEGS
ncbi:MAG: HAD-IIA family hydrolase [Actinomycetes bacterium]